jgi:hypothetical protein
MNWNAVGIISLIVACLGAIIAAAFWFEGNRADACASIGMTYEHVGRAPVCVNAQGQLFRIP